MWGGEVIVNDVIFLPSSVKIRQMVRTLLDGYITHIRVCLTGPVTSWFIGRHIQKANDARRRKRRRATDIKTAKRTVTNKERRKRRRHVGGHMDIIPQTFLNTQAKVECSDRVQLWVRGSPNGIILRIVHRL
jgi:uncharacterized FlgJ-related protein